MGGAGGLVLLGGGAGGCAAAVRSGKAGRLWALCRRGGAGACAWSSWAAVCCWRGHLVRRWRGLSFLVQVVGGAICCGCGVLAWSSWQRRQHPARAGLLIRQAGQAGEGAAKEKCQGGGAWCAAALAFCLHWRCDLLRRVRPGAYRGRRVSAPRSGAGVLVPALIRLHLIHLHGAPGTGAAGTVPPGQFCRLPEGSDSPLYRVVL